MYSSVCVHACGISVCLYCKCVHSCLLDVRECVRVVCMCVRGGSVGLNGLREVEAERTHPSPEPP